LHTCPVCGSTGQSTSSYCTVCGHVLKESLAAAGLARKPSNVPPGNDLAIIRHFLTPQFAENIS
jgi:hypothetical protein